MHKIRSRLKNNSTMHLEHNRHLFASLLKEIRGINNGCCQHLVTYIFYTWALRNIFLTMCLFCSRCCMIRIRTVPQIMRLPSCIGKIDVNMRRRSRPLYRPAGMMMMTRLRRWHCDVENIGVDGLETIQILDKLNVCDSHRQYVALTHWKTLQEQTRLDCV